MICINNFALHEIHDSCGQLICQRGKALYEARGTEHSCAGSVKRARKVIYWHSLVMKQVLTKLEFSYFVDYNSINVQ